MCLVLNYYRAKFQIEFLYRDGKYPPEQLQL